MPHTEFSMSYVGKKLKISRQVLSKNKIRLMDSGLIKRMPGVWPPMYRLTNKAKNLNVNDFSYSTTTVDNGEKIGMEDVCITIPIGDKSHANLPKGFWEKINLKFNNWIPKHAHLKIGDYTIALKETTKNIVIQMQGIRLRNFTEAFIVYNSLVNKTFRLLAQYNYWINPDEAFCTDPEFTYLSDLERSQKDLNRKPRLKVKLGYNRKILLPGDNPEEAQAWFDDTPDEGNFETNDLELARERRMFPLRINQLLQLQQNQTNAMNIYAKEIETHLQTYHDMKEAITEFRAVAEGFKSALKGPPDIPSATSEPVQKTLKSTSVFKEFKYPDILDNMDDWERIKIRVLRNYDNFSIKNDQGHIRNIRQLKAGSVIFVPVEKAKSLIKWGEAELA